MPAHSPRRVSASLGVALAAFIAVALCTLAACSSSKSKETPEQRAESGLAAYQARIRKVVKDKARAGQLIADTAEFQKLVEDYERDVAQYRAKTKLLNADYDATLAQFEDLFAQEDEDRAEYLEKALSLRARMAALTTEPEWAELKKVRVAAWEDDLAELDR